MPVRKRYRRKRFLSGEKKCLTSEGSNSPMNKREKVKGGVCASCGGRQQPWGEVITAQRRHWRRTKRERPLVGGRLPRGQVARKVGFVNRVGRCVQRRREKGEQVLCGGASRNPLSREIIRGAAKRGGSVMKKLRPLQLLRDQLHHKGKRRPLRRKLKAAQGRGFVDHDGRGPGGAHQTLGKPTTSQERGGCEGWGCGALEGICQQHLRTLVRDGQREEQSV